ncbi:MAG: protein kinase, partial [bacterium]
MIGQTVSHYRILEKLGGGGMGVVYKAEDTRLGRKVALKFLPPELTQDENAKKRFIREARAASALDHPNICTVHDIGATPDGRMFICMALYEGETLKRKISRGAVPLRDAIDYGIKMARGLAKAHAHKMVHRDIKPANVMVTIDGEVKIVDFGLARLAGSTRVTKTGSTVGTIAYMSPEQTKSEKVDARSDIFSLGVVLYELITGRLPFDGDNEAAVVYGIMCKDPEPLAKHRNGVSEALQQVIDKSLQKDPNDRYQTAEDLEHDLQRIKGGMAPALPGLFRAPASRRLAPGVGAVAALIIILLAIPRTRQIVTGVFEAHPKGKQIAVIPFENVGGDPSNEAFCSGLMETLTSQLTRLEQFQGSLWVVPASEVRVREVTSPSEAARVFGVNLVVSGGVQRFDGRFRVTLNLIDVAKPGQPRQIDSHMIDNVMANISVLQDEIVVRMAGMLDVNLVPETRRMLAAGGTNMSEAYELYLNGRGYLQ